MEKNLSSYTIDKDTTIINACAVIKTNKSRTVVVIDDGRVIGVISEGDILQALLLGRDVHDSIKGLINHSFKFLNEVNLESAFELIKNKSITMIPVINKNMELVDVITLKDVLNNVTIK